MKTVKLLAFGVAATLLPLVAFSALQRRQQLAQRVHLLEQKARVLPPSASPAHVPWWARDWETASPVKG